MFRFAIIEDDTPTNDDFKRFLEKIWPDSSVMQYFSFETAIVAIQQEDFDLVVSDIDLESGTDKLGGVKIAKALDSRRVPLLIVSGSPQPEMNRELFRALDAWDYLQKPVTEADFATQVKRAIAFRLAQKQTFQAAEANITQGHDPNLVINLRSREMVSWMGKRVNLSMTQIRLVEEMVRQINLPVTFEQFYKLIESGRNKQNLRVHIGEIRAAFKDVDPSFDRIKNKPMIGYFWRGE